MTLIASIQRPEGILTISDIMIVIETVEPGGIVSLPLAQQRLFRPASPNVLPPGSHIKRLAQKAVLFNGDCMALWAGTEVFARLAIKAVAEAFAKGTRKPLLNILTAADLEPKHLDEIELIVFRDERTDPKQYLLNVREKAHVAANIICGGTGAWHAIDDVEDVKLEGERETFERMFFDRAASAIISEVLFRENHSFSYGGWFEFTRCEAGSFIKVPYAIKLWGVDSVSVLDGPLFISGYRGHDLVIFHYDRYGEHPGQVTYVSDFLGRSKRTFWDGNPPDRSHELEFHIVHFFDLSRTYYFVLGQSQLSIKAHLSNSGSSVSMNPTSFNLFLADIRAGKVRGFPVHRTSDL